HTLEARLVDDVGEGLGEERRLGRRCAPEVVLEGGVEVPGGRREERGVPLPERPVVSAYDEVRGEVGVIGPRERARRRKAETRRSGEREGEVERREQRSVGRRAGDRKSGDERAALVEEDAIRVRAEVRVLPAEAREERDRRRGARLDEPERRGHRFPGVE